MAPPLKSFAGLLLDLFRGVLNTAKTALKVEISGMDGATVNVTQVVGTPMNTLGIKDVSVTGTSATIQALLITAGTTLNAAVKKLTVVPSGDVYVALGGAAALSSTKLKAGFAYEFSCLVATDLRFIAEAATVMQTFQEG
jgi:hypothetical protein